MIYRGNLQTTVACQLSPCLAPFLSSITLCRLRIDHEENFLVKYCSSESETATGTIMLTTSSKQTMKNNKH